MPLHDTASPTAVDLTGVCKRYGAVTALDDVSFSVVAGSVHGLLGPNGAGKSTLLRILFGLVRADRGEVAVLDQPIAGSGQDGVAGFADAPSFYPYFTARKNLQLLSDFDGGRACDRVEDVLQTVGLADRSRQKVGGFSTGMRQRLGIAAALLRDPQLLILDEPTSGIDPSGLNEVHDLIEALAAQGRTVLVSSHDMSEVERLCDSVTILRRGRVLFSGTVDQLRDDAPAPRYSLQTSNDVDACALAELTEGVAATKADGELTVHAHPAEMDAFVIALGGRGTAVRTLTRRDTALEALFLRLTSDEPRAALDSGEIVNRSDVDEIFDQDEVDEIFDQDVVDESEGPSDEGYGDEGPTDEGPSDEGYGDEDFDEAAA